MSDTTALVSRLGQEIPDLQPIISGNVEFYEEVLPHVVFGDITRWAQAIVDRDPKSPSLGQLLATLETAWTDDGAGVRELLTVSFLENIDRGSALLDQLGPSLAQAGRDYFPYLWQRQE